MTSGWLLLIFNVQGQYWEKAVEILSDCKGRLYFVVPWFITFNHLIFIFCRSHHDFIDDVTDAFIVAVFLDIMEMESFDATPSHAPVFSIMDNKAKREWIFSASCQIAKYVTFAFWRKHHFNYILALFYFCCRWVKTSVLFFNF